MNLNFNKNKLYKLLRSFYILSGVRIVIFDVNYNEVISYPDNNCAYCKLMDKHKCKLSNKKAFLKCIESDELYIYHCHAYLVEAMINLKINGEIVGFIMFGQISDISDDEKRYNKLKENINSNDEKYLSSIKDIKYFDDEKLQSASTILLSLAKYAISEKMVSIEQEKFINQMNDFIEQNYYKDLSIQDFMDYFNMSRTTLYTSCDKYLNMGISSYLKLKRIEKAKDLLQNSNLTLKEISYKVGFNDYNYFTKIFKQSVGVSSKEYRKNSYKFKVNSNI